MDGRMQHEAETRRALADLLEREDYASADRLIEELRELRDRLLRREKGADR